MTAHSVSESKNDFIRRFVFEHHAVRGQWIDLSHSLTFLTRGHAYCDAAKKVLFEAALATNLLAEGIKFEGRLSLQAQSTGPLSLVLIQANHQHQFRGVLRQTGGLPETDDLKQLMPGAQMALTMEPQHGNRYQGIVPMHHASLAANLEDYFSQSEQLATRLWFFSDHRHSVGLMLQAMPDEHNESGFEHLSHLAETLSADEALNLDHEQLLFRLFHQDPVRLFDSHGIEFHCGCGREKSLASLTLVPKAELDELLRDEGKIVVSCEFCQTQYEYDSIDVEQIFANDGRDMQPAKEQ